MRLIGPPPAEEVPAADLFRLLLEKPRPWVPSSDVPGGGVFAISALDAARIRLEVRSKPKPIQASTLARHEVAAATALSLENTGRLHERELRRIHDAVTDAWRLCHPRYDGRHDLPAWAAQLDEGARELVSITVSLGACLSAYGSHGVERPDWWFQIPLSDLTDGQWMAYRAAVRVAGEWRSNAKHED